MEVAKAEVAVTVVNWGVVVEAVVASMVVVVDTLEMAISVAEMAAAVVGRDQVVVA